MQAYLIETFWSDEDQAYLCIAPDLPGCSPVGWGEERTPTCWRGLSWGSFVTPTYGFISDD
ncbi:hypothetical protein [Methylomagnum sp.]